MTVRLLPLFLLTATTMWAAPEGNLHISISLQALQKLDALASHKIESMEDAAAYVRESVALCVYGSSPIIPHNRHVPFLSG
jgi:hypothetical protein